MRRKQKHCFACGRIVADLNSKHVCKDPDPSFEAVLAEMTSKEVVKALLDCDEYFCEQLSRFLCHKFVQSAAADVSLMESAKQTRVTIRPRQSSEDISRYGPTDQAVAEGEIKEIQISKSEETAAAEIAEVDRGDDKTKVIASQGVQGVRGEQRLGPLKARSFPVPVIRSPQHPTGIVIPDSAAIHDESGREFRLPPNLLKSETPEPLRLWP